MKVNLFLKIKMSLFPNSKLIKSSYTVLTNKPLSTDFSGGYYALIFHLPKWFVDWPKIKIIKVYGCSFLYFETENKEPKLSDKYNRQFVSVHSNIVRDDVSVLQIQYSDIPEGSPIENGPGDNHGDGLDYLCTANNFYNPKIYDVSNNQLTYIKLWFLDSTGKKIPIRGSFSLDPGDPFSPLDEVMSAVIRLECELAIFEN
jgi:hypothetical protein